MLAVAEEEPSPSIPELLATLTAQQQVDTANWGRWTKSATLDFHRDICQIPDLYGPLTPAEATKYPNLAARVTQ